MANDEQAVEAAQRQLYEKMKDMFQDRLADPEVFPRCFAHQVLMARYQIFVETSNGA